MNILLQSALPALAAECLPNLRQKLDKTAAKHCKNVRTQAKLQLAPSMYVDVVPRCCLYLFKAAKKWHRGLQARGSYGH